MGSAWRSITDSCPRRPRSWLRSLALLSACLSATGSSESIRTTLSFTSELRMSSTAPAIRLQNVTQRFRVIQERPDTLRELFAKFLRHDVSYHDFDAVKDISLNIAKAQT